GGREVVILDSRPARAGAADPEPGEDEGQHPGEHHVDADQARFTEPVVPLAVHGSPPRRAAPRVAPPDFLSRAATNCERVLAEGGKDRARTGANRTHVVSSPACAVAERS